MNELFTLRHRFTIQDRVHVDGDKATVGVVTAVQWRNKDQICYEVSWIINGDSKAIIIEEWRLSLVECA